jgi:hypothetical protein
MKRIFPKQDKIKIKTPIAKNLKTAHQTKTLHGNHFMMQKFLPVHLTNLGCTEFDSYMRGRESQ